MKKLSYDLVIVGGGPAGLAAALTASKNGVKKILICERASYLGGILMQCIHNGFGLQYFHEELTGPEYASRFINQVEENKNIDIKLNTMVLDILEDKRVIAVNKDDGMIAIDTKAVILAMGCRERTRGAITTPGTRPSGIFTAGTAQTYVNLEGYMPGKEVVILGSGDIGLIMARRMTLEGATVKAVFELQPYSSGLVRNVVQCLNDYNIPLLLSHTITEIHGKERITGITYAKVGEDLNPIPGTEQFVSCDTLLLSVGLIPENELSRTAGCRIDNATKGPIVNEKRVTNIPWILACGNVLHVHDLVDNVTQEAEIAGSSVVNIINGNEEIDERIAEVHHDANIGYVIPQRVDISNEQEKFIKFYFRVRSPREDVNIIIKDNNNRVLIKSDKEIVEPGTMISIILPRKFIDKDISFFNITVENKQ